MYIFHHQIFVLHSEFHIREVPNALHARVPHNIRQLLRGTGIRGKNSKALCVDPGTPVIHLKRHQLINNVIISYIDSFIVYISADQLARICSQAEKSSIHLILEEQEETAVDDIVRHLSAISANTADAKALGVKPGDPILQMRGEGYSRKDGTPVIVERAIYTAYHNELSYAFKFDPSAP